MFEKQNKNGYFVSKSRNIDEKREKSTKNNKKVVFFAILIKPFRYYYVKQLIRIHKLNFYYIV